MAISQQASFSCQLKSFYVTNYNISPLFYLHTLNGISNIIVLTLINSVSTTL